MNLGECVCARACVCLVVCLCLCERVPPKSSCPCLPPSPPTETSMRSSLVAEANVVEMIREEQELGLRIVGGKDTPLGNIVIQEIIRDSLAARDGRLAPGDHILEVRQVPHCK